MKKITTQHQIQINHPNDPLMGKRLRVVNHIMPMVSARSSTSMLLIIFLLFIGSIAVWYYVPQWHTLTAPLAGNVAQWPHVVWSWLTPKQTNAALTTSPSTSNQVRSLALPPPTPLANQTTAIPIQAQPASTTVQAPTQALLQSSTVVAPAEQNALQADLQSENVAVSPAAEKSTLAQITPSSVDSAQSAAKTSSLQLENFIDQRIEQIQALVAKAKKQIIRTRLTSPQGDNAYETYQALLALDAQKEAKAILDQIIGWYVEKGRIFLKKGDIVDKSRQNAFAMYEKVQSITVDHPDAQALLTEMLDELQRQADNFLKQQAYVTPKNYNAYAIYHQMAMVAPRHKRTLSLFDLILQGLFNQAEKQIKQFKFTTPEFDNAYNTYQKVLVIAPNNAEAKEGIERLVERYYHMALAEKQRGKSQKCLNLIERGLKMDENHAKLLELKKQVAPDI